MNAASRRRPKILVGFGPGDDYAGEVVCAAMVRSFSGAQVLRARRADLDGAPLAAVLINPGDEAVGLLEKMSRGGGKALVLGRPSAAAAGVLGISVGDLPDEAGRWPQVTPDPSRRFDVSDVGIVYRQEGFPGGDCPLPRRALCRCDFTDEWNNMGYGRITADGGPWSLACRADPAGAEAAAWLVDGDGRRPGLYASLLDLPGGSLLWFNRAVGPVDSLEWAIVERFFSDHRPEDLPCLPSLCSVPWGFERAATPRIDCDEAVASAGRLVDLYRSMGKRPSLAVVTGTSMSAADIALLENVLAAGGAVVSHSHCHAEDWGGGREAAERDARQARAWLEAHLPSAGPHVYAASPFHRNSVPVVRGLEDAGLEGFASGSVQADPEFLVGRAGLAPFCGGIVTHSQQCMIHGDCFHRYGDSVEPYLQSAAHYASAGEIFGYSDHPFSERYSYGWRDEDERCRAHEQLIAGLDSAGRTWWCTLPECLTFVRRLSRCRIGLDEAGGAFAASPEDEGLPRPQFRLAGSLREVPIGE